VVGTVADVCAWADLIAILLPDQLHKRVFEESVRPNLSAGKMLLLAHGFSIHFGQIQPPTDIDVAMVAPVGPGRLLREEYVDGRGIPASVAVAQDGSGTALAVALSYARALGCGRAGVLRTTFKEETETDLFGEQAVLCGGLAGLAQAGFETLVEAGYQPELAYFECIHQLKLIVDLVYQSGFSGMFDHISDTAAFGAFRVRDRVVGAGVRTAMREVLSDVRDGKFAHAWIAEADAGAESLRRGREAEHTRTSEQIGARLRAHAQQQARSSPLPAGSTDTADQR
jgi:ketol-acid reductoisomerase